MPTSLHVLLVALLSLLGLTSPSPAAPDSSLTPSDLRCEYLVEPLAIDDPAPRLSWIVSSPRRAEHQTAYQLLVASTPERLAKDEGDLWNSGKTTSSATSQIPYAGKPLTSSQKCYWKVRVWDRDGTPGPWSRPAHWEVGLLTPADWTASWVEALPIPADITITKATYQTLDARTIKDVTEVVKKLPPDSLITNTILGGDPAINSPKHLLVDYTCNGTPMHADIAENAPLHLASHLPYLRKSFSIDKPIQSARLHATALGVYELSLNGQRIGDQHLPPGWTDYRKRVQYQTYNVTPQLTKGPNTLGALVAPGWFSGHTGLFSARRFYGETPALLAQLDIIFTDGTTQRITTDTTWKCHKSPLLAADILDGETYDAAAELPNWNSPTLDDHDWSPVTTRPETRTLKADIAEPVRILTQLTAKSLTEPAPGRWTFDLGQNMVGVANLSLSAPRGTTITIRYGEVLNPDGTIYTANLRGAAATDRYTCRGGSPESWQPRFTFHGFRYVELTGLPAKPSLDTVRGIVIGSDLPRAGDFSCSDQRLNQLQSNITWGLHGNYLSIPTDCPQRDERMGWMADAQVFVPTAVYNADIAAFMSKWTIDIDDAQRADGAHSDVAPVMKGLTYGTPAWADAGTIIPWTIYQTYGDTRILERHIDSMTRWVEWCRANSTNLIRDHARGNDYGDWLSIGADTPKDLIGTAYFARSTDILANSYAALNRPQEAAKYKKLADDIKSAFVTKFVAADGLMAGNTQCDYAIALRFDLLPEAMRAKAIDRLEADIRAHNWHLSTGFVGVANLLPVLEKHDRIATAYRLLLQDTFPSWLFSVKHGATTIWERWDGWTPEGGVHRDASMNSFNHYSLGSCGEWLFSSVAGIASDRPAFEHLIIHPRVSESLTSARATYHSIRGTISTTWTTDNGVFTLSVSIPANTTATVFIPAITEKDVQESGTPITSAEGVKVLRQDPGETVLEVGSGTYTFTAPLPPATK